MTGHTHGPRCLGVQVSEVYDGVLWWMCSDGIARPAHDSGTRGRLAAACADACNTHQREHHDRPGEDAP